MTQCTTSRHGLYHVPHLEVHLGCRTWLPLSMKSHPKMDMHPIHRSSINFMSLDWSVCLISCDCLSSNTDWMWTIARTAIPPFGALCPNKRKLQKLSTRESQNSNITSSWPRKSSYTLNVDVRQMNKFARMLGGRNGMGQVDPLSSLSDS